MRGRSGGSAEVASVVRIDGVERAGSRADKSDVTSRGSTAELHLKLLVLSTGGVIGIPWVAVKCVDIRKNTSGEGDFLDCN